MRGPSRRATLALIRAALREDRATRDITSRSLLPSTVRIRARVRARRAGVLAGVQVAAWVFRAQDPRLRCRLRRRDGARVRRHDVILTVAGSARSILAAERTALNFLGSLSGIATLTRRYVERVQGTRAQVLDTRKTVPGLRALEKYAVRVGGGRSHRADLASAVLIKTNHVLALRRGGTTVQRALTEAIRRAKRRARGRIEVEVRNLPELRAAVTAGAESILLDNWSARGVRRAVSFLRASHPRRRGRPLLEVSGGVTLGTIRVLARTGVDRISIGRLTHTAPSLDVALRVA